MVCLTIPRRDLIARHLMTLKNYRNPMEASDHFLHACVPPSAARRRRKSMSRTWRKRGQMHLRLRTAMVGSTRRTQAEDSSCWRVVSTLLKINNHDHHLLLTRFCPDSLNVRLQCTSPHPNKWWLSCADS